MQMEKCNHKIRCDFLGCANMAKYSFKTKSMFRNEMNFCSDCMKEMYENFSKLFIPKSPEPPFKKQTVIRSEK